MHSQIIDNTRRSKCLPLYFKTSSSNASRIKSVQFIYQQNRIKKRISPSIPFLDFVFENRDNFILEMPDFSTWKLVTHSFPYCVLLMSSKSFEVAIDQIYAWFTCSISPWGKFCHPELCLSYCLCSPGYSGSKNKLKPWAPCSNQFVDWHMTLQTPPVVPAPQFEKQTSYAVVPDLCLETLNLSIERKDFIMCFILSIGLQMKKGSSGCRWNLIHEMILKSISITLALKLIKSIQMLYISMHTITNKSIGISAMLSENAKFVKKKKKAWKMFCYWHLRLSSNEKK